VEKTSATSFGDGARALPFGLESFGFLALRSLRAIVIRALVGVPCVIVGFTACGFPSYELPPPGPRPEHCNNRQKDRTESDYDCGGDCAPCQAGRGCLLADDCSSGVCLAQTCAPPSCTDGVTNGRESDQDCGEACTPSRCARGNACRYDEDCNSFRCEDGQCSEASCDDQLRNGTESDLDCGGACERCPTGGRCGADNDCETGICSAARCAPDSCRNDLKDPGETDTDCGGPDCGPCGGGYACKRAQDCLSKSCAASVCDAASCNDDQKNQDETDIDCGGRGCAGCEPGQACVIGADCTSGVCTEQACQAPSCDDLTQNADETGIDCGGGCDACGPAPECTNGVVDCPSKVCTDGRCQPARCEDGVQNGSEVDVDCGPGCKPCAVQRNCQNPEECATGRCDKICKPTLRLELRCLDNQAETACMKPQFRVTNDGPTAVSLADYSIRYYYTKEGSLDENYHCYYINLGDCNQVAPGHFNAIKPKRPGADRFVEVSFTAGAKSLAPGAAFELQSGICYAQGAQDFTQTGDYSFDESTSGTFKETGRVTMYKNGVLVLGTEP
jgi:hypothetical protein